MKTICFLLFLLLSVSACTSRLVETAPTFSRPTTTKTIFARTAPTPTEFTKAVPATAAVPAATAVSTAASSPNPAQELSSTAPAALASFKWFNDHDGWAVTVDPQRLLRTSDGGAHWLDVTPLGYEAWIFAAFFLDPQNAWFLPATSTPPPTSSPLYHTSDGGATWTRYDVPFAAAQLDFVSPLDGWANMLVECGHVAEPNHTDDCAFQLFQTADGGTTWKQLPNNSSAQGGNPAASLPAGTVYAPNSTLVFQDAHTIWSAKSSLNSTLQSLYVSRDSAHTWQNLTLPEPLPLEGDVPTESPKPNPRSTMLYPPFFLQQEGFLLWMDDQAGIQVFRSHDGGLNWQHPSGGMPIKTHMSNFQPQYATAQDWYIRADEPEQQKMVLCVTHDGGQTWQTLPIELGLTTPGTLELDGYQFIDGKNGWLMENVTRPASLGMQVTTHLYRSDDGGQSWQSLAYSVGPLRSADAAHSEPTATPIPTAPVNGLFAETPTLAPTVIATPTGRFPSIRDMHWIDLQSGYATTADSHLLRSEDGGATWHDISPQFTTGDQVSYAYEPLTGLRPASAFRAQDIWGVEIQLGDQTRSILFHSGDGGRTWQSLLAPFKYGGVTFLDQQNGWAIADGGGCAAGGCWIDLYHTTNGGRTWQKLVPPLSFVLNSGPTLSGIRLANEQAFTFQNASSLWLNAGYLNPGPVPLLVSRDAGKTWQSQLLHLPSDMGAMEGFPVTFLDDREGFAPVAFSRPIPGQAGGFSNTYGLVIFVTQDGGGIWTPRPALEQAGQPTFITDQDWFANCGTQICLTHDAGQSWQAYPIPGGPENLSSVDFVDAQHGWLLSSRPLADGNSINLLYRTGDGGQSWQMLTPVLK